MPRPSAPPPPARSRSGSRTASSRSRGAPLFADLDGSSVLQLVDAASDLALVLDAEARVLEVVTQGDAALLAAAQAWRGKRWADTVTVESQPKVAELLAQAAAIAPSGGTAGPSRRIGTRTRSRTAADTPAPTAQRWRQVNHPLAGEPDLPLLYTVVQISGGRFVAFGRDLRDTVALQRRLVEAQQSMERDYWRFREAETRYRQLFQNSQEAVLIVDGASLRVVEANPAALALLSGAGSAAHGSRARPKAVGSPFVSLFQPDDAQALQALLAAARSVGKHDPTQGRLAASGLVVTVAATAFRHEQAAFLLVRLGAVAAPRPARQGRAGAAAEPTAGRLAHANGHAFDPLDGTSSIYVRNAADAIAFTDAQGRVVSVNRAFVQLAQLSSEDQARGESLERWLGQSGVETHVLIANLREHGRVGLFTTVVRGEVGARSEVEVAASALEPGAAATYAFALRDIDRRLQSATSEAAAATEPAGAAPAGGPAPIAGGTLPTSPQQLAELVGRVPLKQIVAETSDLIEQMSIEAALRLSRDNRAQAAQLLGLSRQSLYVKLRRYGLGDLPEE